MALITKTNAGLNLARDAEAGAANAQIKYVALGTGNTTPAATDTKLVSEVYRKAVSSRANGTNGELITSLYLGAGDANGIVIAEVGIFGGSSATSQLNTGVLIARGLYSHTKSSGESIQIDFDHTYA